MTERPRAARTRIVATVIVAAAVPFVWWEVLGAGRSSWDLGDVQLVARMALLSSLFWGGISAWLVSGASRHRALGSLGLGLFSPVLCAMLAVPIGLAMLPFDFVLGAPASTVSLAWLVLLAIAAMPLAIFPIGLGMGLVAYAIAGVAPGPGRAGNPRG